MKTLIKSALSTLVLGFAAASFVHAQDNTVTVPIAPAPAPEAAPAKHGGKAGAKRMRDRVIQHDKELAEKLALTDTQKQQLADLRKQQAEQMKAVRGDRTKMAEVRKGSPAQVRALLTPEQQTQFDAMASERAGGKGGKKNAGQS